MKFLVAIALLVLAVASATHVPQHTLRGPRFELGKTYKYDVEFNVTAGVLGLSSQVSASVLQAEVLIHAKSESEHLMKISKVYKSGSVNSIDHKYADIPLNADRALEDRLGSPIKFILEDGKVTSYTLSRKDNLESRKIKKSILRSLEMYIPESTLTEMESPEHRDHPILYNTTENTRYGVHVSNYMITTMPYIEYPAQQIVYNISRVDNCEGEWYPGHKLHHNFQKQGCPEVCRQEGEWRDNEYSAGCPNGHEPHQSPIKRSFSHEQSLSPADKEATILTPEVIRTTEVHFANMYDQDMEVLIRYALTRTEVLEAEFQEEAGQQSYNDLEDMESEINEKEIHEICDYQNSEKTKTAVRELMADIAKMIVTGDMGDEEKKGPLVGEKVILLRDILTTLKYPDLREIANELKGLNKLQFATDGEKITRQIWMDILPLVGTPESVKFIVRYIQDDIRDNKILIWEAKEILEALPQNIEKPDAETITEMKKLMQNRDLLEKSHMLHSAVHLALGRVIGEVCGNVPVLRSPPQQKSSWIGRFQSAQKITSGPFNCPEREVNEIVEELSRKLKETRLPEEIAIYIETLTHTGVLDALSVVSEYAYGTAENIQQFSPRFIDFTKSMALHALHNIAGRYPEDVLRVVLPMYFNETETPKVRNAAFGVLIRCQPSLDVLERIAIRSWFEKSYEVGSFVTSTLETFGNSSLPCMQLVSHRIKAVLPQVKKFDVGMHHAKNYMWSYFDALRDFGLEGRLEYTPNNESFIPSTVYHSLSYSMDSLRDTIWQSAVNIEGWTQEKILEKFIDYLNIENIEPIEREEEVFGRGRKGMDFIQPRTVEDLRYTTYTKFFYKTAYYYMNPTILRSTAKEISDVFRAYLRKTGSNYSGYLVKLYLPSSYHTISIAKTLPYPVEFQMRQPVVFALGIKTPDNMVVPPSRKHFDLHFKPSIYMSKLFTHQMKNIGDCKEVGVYHEHKIAMTYPFELKYDAKRFPNVTMKYKVPPAEKRIIWFNTESGTYAGKKTLNTLPSTQTKEVIKTIPTPFKFQKDVNFVGVPPLHVEVYTEDMNLFSEKLPRTPTEALDILIRRVLNAGWRYKHVKIHILEDRALWTGDTEATFKVEYSHKHIPRFAGLSAQDSNENEQSAWRNVNKKNSRVQRQSDEYPSLPIWNPKSRQSDKYPDLPIWNPKSRQSDDYTESPIWTEDSRQSEDSTNSPWWRPDDEETDDDDNDDDWTKFFRPTKCLSISEITKNARDVARILNFYLPHMMHTLNISVTAEPLSSTAYLRMEYNHTYEKDLYSFHAEAASKRKEDDTVHEISIDHLMGYWNRPDEFRYPVNYGKQQAGFFTAFSLPPPHHPTDPWEQMEIAIQGRLRYLSNKKILEPELNNRVDDMYFLPETHEKCLSDVRDGNPMSPDCLKAIREYSIFNRLNMSISWEKRLPETIQQWARVADIYLKHYYFEHMQLRPARENQKGIDIGISYIDKLVDEPVVDLEIRKPSETWTLRRIPVGHTQPWSSVYGMHESWALETSNNTYPPTCLLMENYVQTYDLKTYPFAPRDCYYVLSTHCTKAKNFAVLLRGNKEIHIHVASSKIVLSPPRRENYTVKYEGRDHEILNPVVFHPEHEIYAFTTLMEKGHKHLTVVAKKAGIRVHYDGKNVKIQVSPRYKGELCGLCSEFDGEVLREFRGMDRCLYRDHVDFANSAMVKREGRCRVDNQDSLDRICDDSRVKFWAHTPVKQEEDEPTFMRNVVISRGNEVCFSVRPVPLCEENVEPTEIERQRIGFHCLPKRDLTARKLITEAKWRTLDEIERKSVDYVETIEVPKRC